MDIEYTLVVPLAEDESQATVFQGWHLAVMNENFLRLIERMSILPNSLDEIYIDHASLLRKRGPGNHQSSSAVGEGILNKIALLDPKHISIFLCLEEQIEYLQECLRNESGPYLILSYSEQSNVINLQDSESDQFHFLDERLDKICKDLGVHLERKIRDRYVSQIEVPLRHGVTRPNICLLMALGYTPSYLEDGGIQHDRGKLDRVIIETSKLAYDLFDEEVRPSELIIYSPAVKADFYDFKQNAWNRILRNCKHKWERQLIERGFFRNRDYSSFTVQLERNDFELKDIGAQLRAVMNMRMCELYATSAAIAYLSASRTIPSLRLPNSVNLHAGKLRAIEEVAGKTDKKSKLLLQKRFIELNDSLKNDIGVQLLDHICARSLSATICSDAPLEWIYFDKLPMMISHEVSRIPMTPGNMLLQTAASGSRMVFPESSLRKILVIRSFFETDPIRRSLEAAIDAYNLSEKIDIEFVDVTCRQEAVDALNHFDGLVVIFDCHGSHGGTKGHGWLHFGAERVNTWELAHIARIPPIVLLSACLTAPISGSHVSVTSGLLRSGAKCVIGTFLSVDAIKSAVLIARIIYRIDTFLPDLKEAGFELITWRALVSGLLKRSYVTDVLTYCRDDLELIDLDCWVSIQTNASEYSH